MCCACSLLARCLLHLSSHGARYFHTPRPTLQGLRLPWPAQHQPRQREGVRARLAEGMWLANWKPVAPTPTPTTTGVTTPSPSFTTKALTTEAAKGASSSFLTSPWRLWTSRRQPRRRSRATKTSLISTSRCRSRKTLTWMCWPGGKLRIMKRTACQFLPRWHASSLAARPRLRALSVCSRRQGVPTGWDPRALPLCLRQHRVGMRSMHERSKRRREAARQCNPWGDG